MDIELKGAPPPAPTLVRIDWDERGATSVQVAGSWLEHREPAELVRQVHAAAARHLATARPGSTWRQGLGLAGVPLSELREFTALLREARAEQEAQPRREPQTIASRHCASSWLDGRLTGLSADEQWLERAAAQAISDELVEVLTVPPAPPTPPTPARDRMARFLQETRR